MKIALIGYGKMGKMAEKFALARGHDITAKITSPDWHIDQIRDAELCLEFTNPESVIENIRRTTECKKPIVVGTTGWYDKMDQVHALLSHFHTGLLYGPNFAIGVHLWLEILTKASKMMNLFEEYEAAGIEQHHSRKLDSPSGTALAMARSVEAEIPRIASLPISSIRCGHIPGTHSLLFDSHCDTISITHTSRNREGFAAGAILAAEWLLGKKGLYTFKECMQDIILKRLP